MRARVVSGSGSLRPPFNLYSTATRQLLHYYSAATRQLFPPERQQRRPGTRPVLPIDEPAVMDLFHHHQAYDVLICIGCQIALQPAGVASHLYGYHPNTIPARKVPEYARLFTPANLLPALEVIQLLQVPPESAPILHLKVYHDGYCCLQCPPTQPYIIRSHDLMKRHLRTRHPATKAVRDGHPVTIPFHTLVRFPVTCQTFYEKSRTRYFQVNKGRRGAGQGPIRSRVAGGAGPGGELGVRDPAALSLRKKVEQALASKLRASQPDVTRRHATEVSPWLDMTRYLHDYDLKQAQSLVDLPSDWPLFHPKQSEDHLLIILYPFDRLIEQARESLETDKVNI